MLKHLGTFCVFLFVSFVCKSQSLADIRKLVWVGTIDSAQNVVAKWGFSYETSTANKKIGDEFYDIVYFKKGSEATELAFYRNKSNAILGILFIVQYATYSEDNFNSLKNQCKAITDVKKLNDEINENSFDVYFTSASHKYHFSVINPSKQGGLKTYSVSIDYSLLYGMD